MKPTDTSNPEYFHKVVDCQYGCPAHTDVPEYIRMIAQGRFSDAYMENRKSNVFPGILGRVCDRPCEPVCRRGRVEDKPVAICRLKRVAADNRDDIVDRLPKAPEKNNGKKVALIGAGCASLTVANDLLPLGYEVTIFEALEKTGATFTTINGYLEGRLRFTEFLYRAGRAQDALAQIGPALKLAPDSPESARRWVHAAVQRGDGALHRRDCKGELLQVAVRAFDQFPVIAPERDTAFDSLFGEKD